ncbi:ParA family protein [Thermoflavimicrobium daqui]|jgi:chromosome partitioning protein|uniref:AAA domain-containing protein n=1 Tax=Thermoflavimicrobium daqui TaxID=2137476 RepID=A0A364K1P3_9BACL|nr:ParA family protein [Thermoflavimicrobium daqui]RAL21937.1 hypothetical protein DL897_15210 [Thermoflavimicrobium daqui]
MKTAKVVCVAGQKGGIAKTTTTGSLAFLASLSGYQTLAIDMDTQSDLSLLLTQVDDIDDEIQKGFFKGTVFDAMLEGRPERYINHVNENLDVLVANDDLANLPAYVYQEYDGHPSELLRVTIEPLLPAYDFIFIDTPPSLSEMMTNALGASDYVVIPFDGSRYNLNALRRLFKTVNKIQERVNPTLEIFGILPTLIDTSGAKGRNEYFGQPVRSDYKLVLNHLLSHPEYKDYMLKYIIPKRAATDRLSYAGFTSDNPELERACEPYLPLVEELIQRV